MRPGNFIIGTLTTAALPGGTLDPTTIPKYEVPLFIPPAMPPTGAIDVEVGETIE